MTCGINKFFVFITNGRFSHATNAKDAKDFRGGRAGSMTRQQLGIVNQKPSTAAAYVEAALPSRRELWFQSWVGLGL